MLMQTHSCDLGRNSGFREKGRKSPKKNAAAHPQLRPGPKLWIPRKGPKKKKKKRDDGASDTSEDDSFEDEPETTPSTWGFLTDLKRSMKKQWIFEAKSAVEKLGLFDARCHRDDTARGGLNSLLLVRDVFAPIDQGRIEKCHEQY